MWTERERYIDSFDGIREYLQEIDYFHDHRIGNIRHDGLESKIKDKANDKNEVKPNEPEKRNDLNAWAAAANRYSSYLQKIESINAQWFSAYITALKDQNRQAKAVCVKLISFANGVGGRKEPKSANESVASLLEDRFAALDF